MTRTRLHRKSLLFLGLALVSVAAALVPAAASRGGTTAAIPVIAYHGVTTDPTVATDAADPRFFAVRLSAFEEQMKHLHDAGFETITPAQYKRWLYREDVSLPDKPILVTFDDGEASIRLATPVLKRYGFEAAVYVASGFANGDFGGPNGEKDWYLTWDQLKTMRANGPWIVQFHAGPRGHAYVRDSECHRFYPCRFGEDDATYQARVKSDVAQGLGAMRSIFELPANWRGPTFAVPWDDAGQTQVANEPWLEEYFATQFPVVFVQDSYDGNAHNQRYRFEVHNPDDLEQFESGLSSDRFER